jgi:hypothetical protein
MICWGVTVQVTTGGRLWQPTKGINITMAATTAVAYLYLMTHHLRIASHPDSSQAGFDKRHLGSGGANLSSGTHGRMIGSSHLTSIGPL